MIFSKNRIVEYPVAVISAKENFQEAAGGSASAGSVHQQGATPSQDLEKDQDIQNVHRSFDVPMTVLVKINDKYKFFMSYSVEHNSLYHGLAIYTEVTFVNLTLIKAGSSGGGPAEV